MIGISMERGNNWTEVTINWTQVILKAFFGKFAGMKVHLFLRTKIFGCMQVGLTL